MEFVIFLAICIAIYMVFKRSSKNGRPKQAAQKSGRPKQAVARNDSSKWNHLLFADTETTGLGKESQVVEVAVVDSRENVIFHRRIRPTVRSLLCALARGVLFRRQCKGLHGSVPDRFPKSRFTAYRKPTLPMHQNGMECMTPSAKRSKGKPSSFTMRLSIRGC